MNLRPRGFGFLAAAILLQLYPLVSSAQAQIVRGVVRAESDNAIVAGAFVALVDSSGMQVRGTLSDTTGSYTFAGIRPGVYRLQAERLGYAAFESALFDVGGAGVTTQDITLALRPIELSGISVTSLNRCDLSDDDARRITELWDAARAALRVAAWAVANDVITYDVGRYSREVDGEARVTYQHREAQTYRVTGSPWTQVSTRDFLRDGLVRQTVRGTSRYYMLPVALLLSDAFLETHCFSLAADERRNAVGLAFRPMERSASRDIEGVLWLDAADWALRAIEYEYDEPGGRARRATARAEYAYMPNGLWLLTDWHMRIRLDRQRTQSGSDETYVVDGWQVVRVIGADDGRMLWSDSVALRPLEPGRTATLHAAGIAEFSPAGIAADACAPRRYSPERRTDAVGHVVDAGGSAVFGAEVHVSTRSGWQAHTRTKQSGVYVVCGVPVSESVLIEAEHPDFQSGSATVRSRSGWLIVQSFELTSRP